MKVHHAECSVPLKEGGRVWTRCNTVVAQARFVIQSDSLDHSSAVAESVTCTKCRDQKPTAMRYEYAVTEAVTKREKGKA